MPKRRANLPDKYKYSYEQLLQILYYSGELPFDLYKYLEIKQENYQKQINTQVHKNQIRTVYGGGLGGYVLTTEGRETIESNTNIARHELEINTRKRDIQKRRRMQLYARLYALFDKAGVRYELERKSDIRDFRNTSEQLEFYTAMEYKSLLKERSNSFKGTRVFGYLTGYNKIYPVYMTNIRMPEFTTVESQFITCITSETNQNIKSALLLCKNIEAIGNILADYNNFMINGVKLGKGQDIFASDCYDEMYVIPTDNYFSEYFTRVYSNVEEEKRDLIKNHDIEINTERKSYLIDGYFSEKEPVMIMLNIGISRYKRFVSMIKEAERLSGYIICYKHLAPIIENIQNKNDKITVIGI